MTEMLLVISVLACIAATYADTPANCTYEDIKGTWTFYEGKRGGAWNIDCTSADGATFTHMRRIQLTFPNVAIDLKTNEKGTWTLVYNQGFEVNIGYRQYFGFSKYTTDGKVVTSVCDQIVKSWTHDTFARDWGCYYGKKDGSVVKMHPDSWNLRFSDLNNADTGDGFFYHNDGNYVNAINQAQSSWKAAVYDHWEGQPIEDIIRTMGGPKSKVVKKPSTAPITTDVEEKLKLLPEEFDWRNVNGKNFVSPVRNQGNCGSCFAFASMGMLEARYLIATNGEQKPVFSPQDVVSCSYYAQGCDGGFPYLIGGKYAEDIGVVLESCDPYNLTHPVACDVVDKCRRYYATDYGYVGGFYGSCNEGLMKLALVNNGPIVVGFEVYDDFMHYKSGVYQHSGIRDPTNHFVKYDPFQITNHAVLIVGYGTDPVSGLDYWIVKNSWGTAWGKDGFFWIRRGNDECGIESLAVESFPMATY